MIVEESGFIEEKFDQDSRSAADIVLPLISREAIQQGKAEKILGNCEVIYQQIALLNSEADLPISELFVQQTR